MINDDVITLVREAPKAHGIFEPAAETGRQVFCQVNSVTRSEFWRAHEAGLNPSYVFRLSEAEDYQGEKIVIYRGVRYRVLRAYAHGDRAEVISQRRTAPRRPWRARRSTSPSGR